MLVLFFAANSFFFSSSSCDFLVESAFRCMNLMPIVAFDNFFEDDPPFFGVVPLFCCFEFGVVVVFVSGLAVPGFHIMVMNKTLHGKMTMILTMMLSLLSLETVVDFIHTPTVDYL